MLSTFKLAAIDLDDTLLAPDKSISAANLEVVNTLLNGGIKVVLASRRTLPSMLPYHRKLGLHGPLVTTNGAFVKDPDETDTLLSIALPIDHRRQLIQEGIDRGFAVGMLGWAGLGIAMDHATLAAKQAAKIVGYSGSDKSTALARALAAALDR